MRQTLKILWELKNSSEAEIGRASGYIVLIVAGLIFICLDILFFVPSLIWYNHFIFRGLIIHIIASGCLIKKAIVASRENIVLLIQRSPKVLESIKQKNPQKFEEFLKESEDIVPQGHGKIRLLFVGLIVMYVGAGVYMLFPISYNL